jgi:hypothetical protein
MAEHVEFIRFDPPGSFFLRRLIQADVSNKVMPGAGLERC